MRYRDAPRDGTEVSVSWRSRALPPQSLLLALGCLLLFGLLGASQRVGSIACRRNDDGTGACTMRRANLFTHRDATVTFSRVPPALRVDVRRAGKRWELFLVTRTGGQWLGSRAREAEAEVDASSLGTFLAGNNVGIYTATYGERSLFPWFFLAAAVASLGFGVTRVRSVRSALTIERGRLVVRAGSEKLGEILLHDIDAVGLEPEEPGRDVVHHHLVLRSADGSALRITTEPGIDRAECEAAAEEVRALVARAR